jgi:hypothetical protein
MDWTTKRRKIAAWRRGSPPSFAEKRSAWIVRQVSRGAAQANSHGLQPVVANEDMIQAPKERRRLTIANAFAPLGLRRSIVDILPGLKSRAICLRRFAVEDCWNRAEQYSAEFGRGHNHKQPDSSPTGTPIRLRFIARENLTWPRPGKFERSYWPTTRQTGVSGQSG